MCYRIKLINEFFFVKVVNPDGYHYTWTTNRNWRKTRGPVSLLCYGVDGNRNFEYNWLRADETGNEGGSRVPCTDTFGITNKKIDTTREESLISFNI